MDSNYPSDNRGLNQNYPPGPQQASNFQPFQPVGVQINQQSYQPQQGYVAQQGYPPQQGYVVQQGYPTQQVYAQPVIVSPGNINSLVVNQPINTNIVFGRAPVEAICPRCKAPVTTVVEDRCNGAAWGFCCVASCIYACYQSYRGKDLGCTDTQHFCPNCKQIIGAYVAM